MGLFDWIASWFSSNKETFTPEQQKYIQDMLNEMRNHYDEQLNTSISEQHTKMTAFVQRQSTRLTEDLVDTKSFLLRQMKIMKEQMEKLQEEMENEKKKLNEKKTEQKEEKKPQDEIEDIIKKISIAMALELKSSMGSSNQDPGPSNCPNPYGPGPSSFRHGLGPNWNGPGPNWNGPGPNLNGPGPNWNGPGPSWNRPGPNWNGPGPNWNGPGPSWNGPGPGWNDPGSNLSAPHARNNPTQNSHNRIFSSNNRPKNVIFPEKRDNLKNAKERDDRGKWANESSHQENNNLSDQHKYRLEKNHNENGNVREQCQLENIILPDKRDYRKYGQKFEETIKSNKREGNHPKPKSVFEQCQKTFSKGDLILPDLRDYKRRNIDRKGNDKDEEKGFQKILDNFFENYSPQNTSNNADQNKEKIANNVHDFFSNKPSNNSSRSSVKSAGIRKGDSKNTSEIVKDWLKDSETYSQKNDDGFESDSSATSAKTTKSSMSQMSVSSHFTTASGKRVFWNKKKIGQQQPKTGYDGNQKNKSNDESKSSGYDGSQYKNRKYNVNQRKPPSNYGKKDGQKNDVQNTGRLSNNRNYEFKKKFKDTRIENKNENNQVTNADRMVNVAVEVPCTNEGKQNEVDSLKKIQYPSEKEARQKNLDLNKPLEVKVMLVGKKDGELKAEVPECLADIYEFEKRFDSYEVITM